MATVILACVGMATAWAAPAQFDAWGAAGPVLPPVPQGWTEIRDAQGAARPAVASPEDRRRGYILFARDPLAVVPPHSVPYPSERCRELRAFAARGEYEPLSLLVHALEPLPGLTAEVTELRSAAGDAIPSSHVDVRAVRCIRVPADTKAKTYRLAPFLLERRERLDVKPGATAQIWLTLAVPETAAAGDYAGAVTVRAAGRGAAAVRISVRVLPFALPPAPIEMAMFLPRPSPSDEMLRRTLVDLREHGLNAIEPAMGVEIKSRDRTLGDDDVAATRAHCRRMMRAAAEVFGKPRFPVTFEVGHQIAFYWDRGKNWFAFWPHSPAIEGDLFKGIEVVRQLAKAEGWPPLRVFAIDEAAAHNLLDEAAYYYGLIKRRLPDLPTRTTIGGGLALGSDEIGRLSPHVDFFSTNRFTPEIARALEARRKPYGIYNGAGPTPAGARFFFGFWGWKTGAAEIAQWVYHFGDAALRGRGLRQGDEGYVYLAADGPLPTIPWEAVREGIDDYRYVSLLWRMIGAAGTSKEPAARRAAAEAKEALMQVLGHTGWGFQALDSLSRTAPPHPSALRKWRWAVAAQILKLQRVAGPDALRPPAVPPLGVFDLPWAAPPGEKVGHGPELLPPSGFEGGLAPWRIEPWNGKGSGSIDPREHHGGGRSARIESPEGAAAQAVTVLVWPSWGKDGLKLSLKEDRTYEFAAWAKWRGRATPPGLRVTLPPGAARATTHGKDEPAPDGWQRLWTRVEMSHPATPKYLAVWVQGPGTVWVDDLSLREIRRPPVRIALDQAEYDAADTVAVATVTVEKRVAPASIRSTLANAAGEIVARLSAPLRPKVDVASAPTGERGRLLLVAPADLRHFELVFDPSALPPGRYQATVELLDSRGKTLGSSTATCQRLALGEKSGRDKRDGRRECQMPDARAGRWSSLLLSSSPLLLFTLLAPAFAPLRRAGARSHAPRPLSSRCSSVGTHAPTLQRRGFE